MRRILLSVVLLSILMASTLVGCSQGQSTPSLTVFSTSGGNVSVMRADAANWVEAEVGMPLKPGDIIKCGDDSGAEITFLDGSTIELLAGTEIEVVLLGITDAGCATMRFKQIIGSIIFRVTKIIDRACRYEVETPVAAVAIRGSAMQVYVIENGTTWACNLEGEIWAFAQGVELQIPEGRCCVIRPGQPPKLICDLTISSATGGSVTTPREGTFPYDAYDEGTVVDLVAEPDEGYHFVNWTGDVGTIANLNAASTTVTMNGDYSITANFVAVHDLSISSTAGGSVTTPGEGTFTYDPGTLVNLVATPDAGYRFVIWTGDVGTIANVNAASITVAMNGDYSITAKFMAVHDLSISSTAGGSVTTPGEGTFTHDQGTLVNLVATPDAGYRFVIWTGDVGTIANVNAASTTITMNDSYSIRGNFAEEPVYFPDPNLEAVIREDIGKPTGPIYPSDLEGVIELSAWNSDIADITGLEYCTNIIWFDFLSNQISDISPLANLTNLRQLFLSQNQISDISPLTNLTNLDYVDFSANQLSDISPLADLVALTSVNLAYNQLSNISPLADLSNADWMRLDNNQIDDISPLASLTHLSYLYLRVNQISNISPLASLTNLSDLDISANQISDISPLASLMNLDQLFLSQNQISDISPLANLTDLYSLLLYSNQITDISPLANLTNLMAVNLRFNQVSDISPLTSLTSLVSVDVRSNQISDISPLASLTNLDQLLLSQNQISDISPLVENLGLGEGDTVWLENNPLSPDSINIYIPELQARGVTVYY